MRERKGKEGRNEGEGERRREREKEESTCDCVGGGKHRIKTWLDGCLVSWFHSGGYNILLSSIKRGVLLARETSAFLPTLNSSNLLMYYTAGH